MKNAEYKKEFVKVIKGLTGRRNIWKVWSDFVLVAACTISNACDISNFKEREEQYLKTVKDYTREELEDFAHLIALLSLALTQEPEQDFLGEMYMELELANKHGGQFFTPYSVCKLMAQVTVVDVNKAIEEKGYITLNDPTCGAGATLIAAVNEIRNRLSDNGIRNYQRRILVAAQDIDFTTAMMCYLQLSMLGVAAYVKVGNSLIDPMTDHDDLTKYWYTPMYVLNRKVLGEDSNKAA